MVRTFSLSRVARLFRLSGAGVLCGLVLILPQVALAEDQKEQQGIDVYGQINRGILFFDDGADSDVYPFVDSSKSVSRLGVTYDTPMNNGWQFQARGEVGLVWGETNAINQVDGFSGSFGNASEPLRKLEVSFSHPDRGTFYLGQGAMASDGVTGQDLSLTNVVAGAAVKDVAGGFYFRRTDGTLTNFRIKDRFRTLGSSRRLRVRYDTPINNNLSFSVAAGREVLEDRDGRYYADAAVRYDGQHGDWRYRGAAAVRWAGGYDNTQYRPKQLSFIASGSILHKPSRYNLTLAYGIEQNSGYYAYAKFGRRWYKFLPYGWTAASLDYYYYEDSRHNNQVGNSIGLAVVQQFKAQKFEVYATIRNYDYDDDTADYFDSYAVLTGIRWRF
ncbi:porin [Tropicibacter sp. Alg240-R139]|uniref:porin n=1 Tax=Tropicibacter sp. Alg240-R139 TaxID=2305991 RepID=UPI0013E0C842|nr:porin [Tropicibacter sp. Alg240-R139]